MSSKPLRFTDGVVTIRKLRRSDKFRLTEIANNEKIAANLRDSFPSPYTLEDAQKFISMCLRQVPYEIFAIEFEGEFVGTIGIHRQSDVYRKTAELGYLIGEPYWHKGIAPRAVNLICEYGFREMDIIKIFSAVFAFNTASQRVLEKCGFTLEAVLKAAAIKNGRICDEYRYALIHNRPN